MKAILLILLTALASSSLDVVVVVVLSFLARMPRVHWLSASQHTQTHTNRPTPQNKWLRQQTCLHSVFVFISSPRRGCVRKRDTAIGRGQGPRPRIRESPPQVPPRKVNLPLQLAAAAAAAAEEEANDQEGKPVQIGSSLGQGLGLSLGQVANSQLLYLSHLLLIPGSSPMVQASHIGNHLPWKGRSTGKCSWAHGVLNWSKPKVLALIQFFSHCTGNKRLISALFQRNSKRYH